MTIGICKKRLREWKRISRQKGLDGLKSDELLDNLIAECKELNPWLPIDENTSKDRKLQLFYPKYGQDVGYLRAMTILGVPTHYKELPEDPKE